MSGTEAQRSMVRELAPEWTQHANLKFQFTDEPTAEIRVNFDANDGAWSYVGTDNSSIPRDQPTLNLGWVDKAVILHEFGHMIGLAHEHQNPQGGIQWNESAVLRDLAGPPNFWDEATTRHNVLNKYTADQVNGTAFDPASIMLYAFPPDWTTNLPQGTRENHELSAIDKDFIRSAKMYPRGAAPPEVKATVLPVWTPLSATIGTPGEEDLYQFVVETPGSYIIETEGASDVMLALFGPNNPTSLVGRDDDGGQGSNARLRATLQPGTYFAAIRHYDRTKTGGYEIRVGAWPR